MAFLGHLEACWDSLPPPWLSSAGPECPQESLPRGADQRKALICRLGAMSKKPRHFVICVPSPQDITGPRPGCPPPPQGRPAVLVIKVDLHSHIKVKVVTMVVRVASWPFGTGARRGGVLWRTSHRVNYSDQLEADNQGVTGPPLEKVR